MKTLKDLGDLKGKRVLVRADFNVPLDGTTITDDGRIKAALRPSRPCAKKAPRSSSWPTLAARSKVVPELSLAPVAARLGELLGANVPLAKDTYGEDAQAKVAAMNDGDVVLLENVRFNPEETSKDADERAAYAKKIAALGEAFVSDGFGVVHRAQAPTTTLPPICRPPQACWSRRKSRPCPRPPRTRSVRSPWCLAVPRSPTSSASSRTCSTRPTVWSSAVAWCSPSSRPRLRGRHLPA